MNKITITVISLGIALLSGCASVTRGTHQNISVVTPSVQNAQCALENSRGKWYINGTPGSVNIHKSYSDLFVTCKKAGYGTGTLKVKSITHPAVFGNILLGGVIGAGVDTLNGSAYEYPKSITVPLRR